VNEDEPTDEPIAPEELARLRRIEAAASEVLDRWDGSRRSATPLLAAIANLRAALAEDR
jgi:hypothetical protein